MKAISIQAGKFAIHTLGHELPFAVGGAVDALNVSSKNVTPTPFVPPTSFNEATVHALPFIISANSAKRTQMTFPSSATPTTDCLRKFFCSLEVCPTLSGKVPNALPNAASTFAACRIGKRSTAAEFWGR